MSSAGTTTAAGAATGSLLCYTYQRLNGAYRPNKLSLRNNLAAAYQLAGDLRRVIPLFEATLADSQRVLGPDHPTTRIIRSGTVQRHGDVLPSAVLDVGTSSGKLMIAECRSGAAGPPADFRRRRPLIER